MMLRLLPRLLILGILLLRNRVCCTVDGKTENQDATTQQLPVDLHLSAIDLPVELSSNCVCDRLSTSCFNRANASSCGARIFYLIVVHNNRTLDDALFLFRGIRDARNTIFVHIDSKFGMGPYMTSALRQEIEACPCGSHVEVASVEDSKWGTWSMNKPTFWGLRKAVKDFAGKWDVFINLSGDTLPVYKPERIAHLFSGPLAGINFVTSHACETGLIPTSINFFPRKWHKRNHYSENPASLEYVDENGKLHKNAELETFFGSQWMALTAEWCQFLIQELDRPDSLPSRFRDYLIATKKLMTDETFIPTLLMHYIPESMPRLDDSGALASDQIKMYAIRYERMDEHVPTSYGDFPTDQRYEVPESSGIDSPRPWGPYFLGVYDLKNIRDSGSLFIRKVATVIDHNMYTLLPVDNPYQIPSISWPKDVQVIPAPDWERWLANLEAKHGRKEAKVDRKDVG